MSSQCYFKHCIHIQIHQIKFINQIIIKKKGIDAPNITREYIYPKKQKRRREKHGNQDIIILKNF